MPHVEVRVSVTAPRSNLWEVLRESVDHPDRFLENIGAVHVVADGERAVDRTVHFAHEKGVETTIRERIAIDAAAGTVVATLVDDPAYRGTTTYAIADGTDGTCALDGTLAWDARGTIDADEDELREEAFRAMLEELRAAAEVF